ncbi:non-ribosomal peptide synthetase [Streptomyces pinistramenti]|uniref:non-ribosomal peptide synthetase n=1 Tax=Streptomyces pinistramenti TaxID=2884812 RepID=UPI001D0804A3|nr:non-ribosomal peptide synthetase [Streptomyces pinistramenti]MCB5909708.1 amino acid adenylation domain-containing protein [Streptomyces pinistramenti]
MTTRTATIVDIVRQHAERTPDRPACLFLADGVTETARRDFAAIDLRARAVAAELAERGCRGERVLIAYPSGIEYVESFLGCLYAGSVAVPCDSGRGRAGAERLAAISADARPALVLCQADDPPAVSAGVPRADVRAVSDAAADSWTEAPADPGATAFLQYTSGSTRTPRGVRVSHTNILSNERAIQLACGNDRDATFVGWLPLFHDMGLIANILQPLYLGSRSVLMPPSAFLHAPLNWLRAVEKYRARVSGGPNFAYELCLQRIDEATRATLDLSHWAVAYNGAEPVRAATLHRFSAGFRAAGFAPTAHFPCYGLAEATLIVTATPFDRPPTVIDADPVELRAGRVTVARAQEHGSTLVSSGLPVVGTEVSVVDPDTRTALPEGRVGEIWLRGEGIAAGYHNRPAETEETFGARLADTHQGPYLRTGDLGFLRDGGLHLTGRSKDLIVIRGENHYPHDLEHTAERADPALRPSCGAAFPVDADGAERLVLCYELGTAQDDPDLAAIAARVRQAIATRHGIETHRVVFLPKGAVPKTTSGKVRRQYLRQSYADGELQIVAGVGTGRTEVPDLPERDELGATAPGDRTAVLATALARTASALAGLVGTPPCPDEPLVRLGLDSLRAMELRHRVQRRYGVDIGPGALADGDSPYAIAGRILAADPASAATLTTAVAADGDALPLTANQEALWFEHELDPQGAAYNLSRVFRLDGPLDVPALDRALATVTARHPALRTRFWVQDGRPWCQAKPEPARLRVIDTTAERDEEIAARLLEIVERPFALGGAAPFTATLLRRGADTHLLVLVAHHLVADLWSFLVVLDELRACYLAETTGIPATLPPAVDPQAAMLAGAADHADSPAGPRDLAYWRAMLAGAPGSLELPTDRPHRSPRDFRGATAEFRVPPELVEALRALAKQRNCTLFTVLLAAYRTLLHRCTARPDLVLGTLLAGRDSAELAGAVGYFVHPVPLRSRCPGGTAFATLLTDTRSLLREAVAHGTYPFRRLVTDLAPARDTGRATLVQSQFVLQQEYGELRDGTFALAQGAGGQAAFGAATASVTAVPRRWSQLDLSLSMVLLGGELTGCWEYRTSLFDADTVAAMSAHLTEVLRAVAADPDIPVEAIPLSEDLTGHAGSGRTRRRPDPGGLHRLVATAAAARPDATAVLAPAEDGGTAQLSYAALHRAATTVAARLRELGARPGEPIAVLHRRGRQLPIGYLAVLNAGCAVLPLDPEEPPPRHAAMLADSGARFLLTEEPLLEHTTHLPVRALLTTALLAARPERRYSARVHPEQPAYLLYTSGSTGTPKGVLVPHRGIVNRLAWMQEEYRLGAGERVLHKTPVGFDVSWWELCWPLIAGGTVVLAAPGVHRDPRELVRLIERARISTTHFVPSMFTPFLAEAARTVTGRSPLRRVLCSGEVLTAVARDRFFELYDARLHNLYGPTEASVDVTAWPCAPSDAEPIPIGRPISNTSVRVLDDRLRPMPVPVPGELFIGGDGLATCYLGLPEQTAQAFLPDPRRGRGRRIYRTGDRARRRTDGALVFLGRTDDQVKIGGNRVELGEVAELLRALPGVADAVAIVRDGRLTGYVTGQDIPPPAELRDRLRRSVPGHLVPSALVLVGALPVTASGKVDRRALPAPDRAPEQDHAPTAALSPAERGLADLWGRCLGRTGIDVRTDFFTLGGDSILAIRLVAEARAAGFDFTVTELLAHPSVAELAAYLDARPETRASEQARETETVAPFALCPALEGRSGLADAYPISMAQRALLAHRTDDPGYEVYVTSVAVDALIAPGALEQAVAHVLARHPYLRSRFDLTGHAEPVQIVPETVSRLPVEVIDQRAEPARDKRFGAWMLAERKRHFDLDHGPLVRFTVHDYGSDFRLTVSSFALDGWCTALVLTDLLTAYRAALKGPLPDPAVPRTGYADFVALERAAVRSPGHRAFWAAELHGAEPSTLPRWTLRRPPAEGPVYQRRTVVEIDDAVRDGLLGLAAELGVGLKHVLLGVHLRVVRLLTGRRDLITGLETNGRPERADGDRVVGVFNNILPLRVDVPAEESWARLALAAYAAETRISPYRRYPLVTLNREFGVSRLFDTLFVFTHFRLYSGLSGADGLAVSGLQAPDQTYLPLTAHFNVDAQSGRLRLLLEADPVRSPDEQTARIAEWFRAALETAARAPHRSSAGIGAQPHEPPATLVAPPKTSVHDLIEAVVRQGADRTALLQGGRHLSYRLLWQRSGRLAALLQARSAGPETVVGLWAERSVDAVVGMLAVLRAGAAYLPIDPETPSRSVPALLAEAGAALLVLPPGTAAPAGVDPRAMVRTDDTGPGTAIRLRRPELRPEHLVCVLATSGSTGRPKLVGVTHQGLVNYLRWCVPAYGISDRTFAPVHSSLAFDLTVTALLAPLVAGGTAHLLPGTDPTRLGTALAIGHHTLLKVTPSHLSALTGQLAVQGRGLTGVTAVVGGEQLDFAQVAALREVAPDAVVFNEYGPTETVVGCCVPRVGETGEGPVPIGSPVTGSSAAVLAAGAPAPAGVPGELAVGGYGVARGYLGRPADTADVFVPDPGRPGARRYRTGDVVHRLATGALLFHGRTDRQVKIRGFRVELGEIEQALAAHPAVARAAVLLRTAPSGAPRLVAYWCPVRPGHRDRMPQARHLRGWLAARLPGRLVPTEIQQRADLPLTRNGKIDYAALPGTRDRRDHLVDRLESLTEQEADLLLRRADRPPDPPDEAGGSDVRI